jgi:lipopolysaccharide heptosyltransferase I
LTELEPKRIGLIKPSALGDIVHSLPVLTALRGRFPRAHITWIVNRGYAPLLEGHPDLDETLPFDRGALRAGLVRGTMRFAGFVRELRGRRFDLVIDLQGLLRTSVMAFATGAPRRIGLGGSREGARLFYTDLVHVPDFQTTHAVDRYWRVVEALGASEQEKQFRVPLTATAREWAARELAPCPAPWLMIGVGSRWQTKRWPPEHFASLARAAQCEFGGTAIFVGGADETALAEQASQNFLGPVRLLTGRTTLPQLTAILAQADVMLANDTGPLHLAAALGRPVVAPYTCTKVARTGPYGQLQRGVETRVWCRGSYIKKCDRLECMAELTPDRLWPHVHEILRRWQRQSA